MSAAPAPPAPPPSEPPPPAGAAATRYEGNTRGTNEREGRVGSTNGHRGYEQVWGGYEQA